jgi:hypothetical protein
MHTKPHLTNAKYRFASILAIIFGCPFWFFEQWRGKLADAIALRDANEHGEDDKAAKIQDLLKRLSTADSFQSVAITRQIRDVATENAERQARRRNRVTGRKRAR